MRREWVFTEGAAFRHSSCLHDSRKVETEAIENRSTFQTALKQIIDLRIYVRANFFKELSFEI